MQRETMHGTWNILHLGWSSRYHRKDCTEKGNAFHKVSTHSECKCYAVSPKTEMKLASAGE